jgi:NADH-quinone oxidoreductase subunit K
MDISLTHYLLLSALLFCLGLLVVLTRKNTLVILMGIELMLNASMINLVGFARKDPTLMAGQVFSLFIIVIAAASAAVGLALILNAYDRYGTVNLNELNRLKN